MDAEPESVQQGELSVFVMVTMEHCAGGASRGSSSIIHHHKIFTFSDFFYLCLLLFSHISVVLGLFRNIEIHGPSERDCQLDPTCCHTNVHRGTDQSHLIDY